MLIYFLFVLISAGFSSCWCMYRFKKYGNVKKPLYEATFFNILIHILGSIWWIITQKDGRIVVPGIMYYLFACLIIFLINRLILSLLKDKNII